MPAKLDVTGIRFARLVAVAPAASRNQHTFWLFRCDCGVEKEIMLHHVKRGRTRSCGCLLDELLHSESQRKHCRVIAGTSTRTHGMSGTPAHAAWKNMLRRCQNPRCYEYRWYGALGVRVCERWKSLENFYADMGEPNGLTLDRIDPRGNYEPGNCRWTTWEIQRANTRRNYAADPPAA